MALRFDQIELAGTSSGEKPVLQASGNAAQVSTPHGYIDIGPKNTSYSHFYTDRAKYYFDKRIMVDEGIISSFDEDLHLKVNNDANTVITLSKTSPYNVGIGETNPGQKLHVAGNIYATGQAQAANAIMKTYSGYAMFGSNSSAVPVAIGRDATNLDLIINSLGKVGIGTTSPSALLDVGGGDGTPNGTQFRAVIKGTGTRTLYLDSDGSSSSLWWGAGNVPHFALDSTSGGGAQFWTYSGGWNRRMDITASGNVGIGTTSPGYLLDVAGYTTSNYYRQTPHGEPRNNLGDPTVTEMALFDSQFTPKTTLANSYNDLTDLTFWVQSTSGSAWTEVTSYSDDQKRRFLRTNNSSVVIPNQSYKFRVEFNAFNYTYANALYMYWSSQSHSTTVHIWKQRASDDTWIQHTSSTNNVSSWPGHLWLPFSTIPWLEDSTSTSTGHYHKIRVEFEPTWSTGTYYDRDIALYGGQIWGGYPSGRRTPHYYDQDGILYTWGDLVVNGGDITLNGTGRIQGVDIVSAGTDAANKTYVDNAVAAITETDTLDSVTDRGSTTTNSITTGNITANGSILGGGNLFLRSYNNDPKGIFFRDGFEYGDTNQYNLSITIYDDGDGAADGMNINAWDGIYFNVQSGTTPNTKFRVLNTEVRAYTDLYTSGDLTVSGGDITLGGTGRIQGIDTVSANTDAANKLYVDNAVAAVPGTVTSIATTSPILGGTITSTGTISLLTPQNGDWWNGGAVVVGTDGVAEVGKYFDMHATDTATSDFDVRLTASTGSLAISGDLVVSGGDITLSGTGRIQGVDTVSAGTDAVNKTYVDTNFAAASHNHDSDYVNVTGDTMTGGLTATQFKLNNNVSDTNADSFFVYKGGGSVAYGMTLWNTSATSGEWATMIYGPNQSNRRISFGKANSNFGTSHAGIDELAWLDLDTGNYFTDGSIYPSNQTTHYVDSGRIQNWQTAYNNSITSAAVTGTTTKTLTLNQQDGGTVQASWSDADSGVTGSGATNYLTYWDSASTIDDTNVLYTTNGGLSIDNSSVNTRSYNLTHTGEDTYSLRHGGANGGFSVYNTTDVRTEMLFDGTGNVGIGAAAPGTKLTVDGITTSKGFQTNTANTNYNLISRNSAGNATLYVQSATSNTNQPIAQFNHGSATANAGTQVLRVAKDESYFINTDLGIGTSTPAYPLDVTGNVRLTGDLYVNGGQVYTNNVQSRTKLMVWSGTTYGIGMDSGFTYGHIGNDYVMSFQMSNSNARGFWWGDTGHSDAQGAMSLTTQGKATIATSLSVGEGETITSPSDKTLHVEGETETTNLSYPYPTATDQFHGEIVTFGSFNGTIVAGDVIVYTTAGVQTGWFLAQGNVTYSKGMLGIAMGTSASDGILIKGFARHASFASGGLGSPLYLSPTSAGDTTNTIPSSTNNIVRIVGYMLNPTNDEIFFDPDKSWVQVS